MVDGGDRGPIMCTPGLFPNSITMLDGDANGANSWKRNAEISGHVDRIGMRSMRAQGLGAPVTVARKTDGQRVYLLVDKDPKSAAASASDAADAGPRPRARLIGLLKVGHKNLYMYDARGAMQHLPSQLCVLDFYVDEEYQRLGVGRSLFEGMLGHEEAEAPRLAYDRPSPKLLGFLRKHYGLTEYTPQTNNYVLFENGLAALSPAVKKSDWDSVGSRPLTHRAGPGGRRR